MGSFKRSWRFLLYHAEIIDTPSAQDIVRICGACPRSVYWRWGLTFQAILTFLFHSASQTSINILKHLPHSCGCRKYWVKDLVLLSCRPWQRGWSSGKGRTSSQLFSLLQRSHYLGSWTAETWGGQWHLVRIHLSCPSCSRYWYCALESRHCPTEAYISVI